jgi:hypothetical protein
MEIAGSSETPVISYQLHCQYSLVTAVTASNLTHMLPYVLSRSCQGIETDNNFRPLTIPRDSSTCSKKPNILPIMLHALITQSSLCERRNNVKWKESTMHENYVRKFLQSFVTSPLSKSVASSEFRVQTLSIYSLLQNRAREQVKQCSFYIGKDYEEADQRIIILLLPTIKGRRVRPSLLLQSRLASGPYLFTLRFNIILSFTSYVSWYLH